MCLDQVHLLRFLRTKFLCLKSTDCLDHLNQDTWIQIITLQPKSTILNNVLHSLRLLPFLGDFLPCHKWVYSILKENDSGNTFCINGYIISEGLHKTFILSLPTNLKTIGKVLIQQTNIF